jgi:ABC-type uncharacterized transport system substrate-binding protein
MRHLLLVLLLTAVVPTAAGAARVQVLTSSDGEPYDGAARELVALLEERGLVAERAALDPWRPDPEVALVVTLGTRAAQTALRAPSRPPVLAALLPRDAWEQALAGATPGAASALWLDQPFDRQLRLLRLVAPNARKVGSVLGPATIARRAELERSAAALGLEMRVRAVAAGDDPARALGALMDEVDAVLALPEPAVWNRVTVQPLLLATFRAGKPVLAFSPTYVRAGAVAAVHSTPSQVAQEVADRIARLDLDGVAAPPLASRHAARFEVATNAEVARALGLTPGDAAALAARLRALEDRE